MKDMLEVLKQAKHKKIFATVEEFKEILIQIQLADIVLKLDWDDGAGEEWAKLSNLVDGIMINCKIGIIFVRKNYEYQNIEHILNNFEIVFTEDYCSEEWYIDVDRLEKEIPEIYWHASENAVDRNSFSLDDLYFATI